MKELVTKIDAFRRELGMKQEELAERVGVRRETISRLEKGLYNPSLKLAADIAEVFGVPIEDVFQFVEVEDEATRRANMVFYDREDGEELEIMLKGLAGRPGAEKSNGTAPTTTRWGLCTTMI